MQSSVTDIRVLTIWEPWATLLAYGIKQWETRPGHTSHVGKPYLIHSAKLWNQELEEFAFGFEPITSELERLGITKNEDFHRGHIIGQFIVDHCATIRTGSIHYDKENRQINPPRGPEYHMGDYRDGRSVWIGKDHQVLSTPLLYRGGQGYYRKFTGDYNSLEFCSPQLLSA